MAKYTGGLDALEALNTNDGGSDVEFFSLKSGTSVRVRVLGLANLIRFRGYGIYKKINTFVADKPSVYNKQGYPSSDLTVWDEAFNYYSDLAFAEKDKDVQKKIREESRKYLGKERFALGFINLETGEPIIIDLSKKQALSIHAVFKEVDEKGKLDKKAFKISKSGSGTDTVVTASTLDLDDLSADEMKHYEGAPEEFDMSLFEDLLYTAERDEQIELLDQAGFDLSLIGLKMPAKDGETEPKPETEGAEADGEDYDF